MRHDVANDRSWAVARLPPAIPAARRVGVLVDETDPFAKPYVAQIGQAARSAGMEVEPIMTRSGQPLEAAFETLTGKRVDGLLIQGSIARREILDLAIKRDMRWLPVGAIAAQAIRPRSLSITGAPDAPARAGCAGATASPASSTTRRRTSQ